MKRDTVLFLIFFLLGVALLLQVSGFGISGLGIDKIFGNRNLLQTTNIEIVDANGTVVGVLSSKDPLSIIAIYGTKTMDLTRYFDSAYPYYFKFTTIVKPTFNASGTAKIVYEITWNEIKYNNVQVSGVYTGQHISQATSGISLPRTVTVTDNSPKSGEDKVLSDYNAVLLVKITRNLEKPPVGSIYELKGSVTVKATLYVDGVQQGNPISQTANFVISIKNQPDGTLSAIDVRVDIETIQLMW